VPKLVDHEERRQQIAQALWRVAAAEGLRAATLRRVAAEADVSMRLVQYYFTTKNEMLRYGLRRLIEVGGERLQTELAPVQAENDPRTILRTCLVALLPTDEPSHLVSAVQAAYFAYSLTDPDIAALTNRVPRDVAINLAAVIRAAQQKGEIRPEIDAVREMDALMSMLGGLVSGIMVGTYTAAEGIDLVDYRLGLLFTNKTPARSS
jgi:AcrR family transcriptional regulator